jgi:hypothetical protein
LQACEDEEQFGHVLDAAFNVLLAVDSILRKNQPPPNISEMPSDYVGTYVATDIGAEVMHETDRYSDKAVTFFC